MNIFIFFQQMQAPATKTKLLYYQLSLSLFIIFLDSLFLAHNSSIFCPFLFILRCVDETQCLYDDVNVVATGFYWCYSPLLWHLIDGAFVPKFSLFLSLSVEPTTFDPVLR